MRPLGIAERARDLPQRDADMTEPGATSLSGRVEQIFEKDAWSHEQLADLVRKLVSRHEASA